jgi:tagaturonate reductase
MERIVQPTHTALPPLSRAHWPPDAYRRDELPERMLQFGTGMLLRALCVAAVDAANRVGAFNGRIVVVQSTPAGQARELTGQDGLFTVVERGLWDGAPIERTRLVGAVSRALIADGEWRAVRDVIAQPEVRVLVSNVTEAGFRLDEADVGAGRSAAAVPRSFPARLTDLLHTRFARLPGGPPLYVIPTELVPDNGPRLQAMVEDLAARRDRGEEFRAWLASGVRFCSSLVDRITTGAPSPAARPALEARLGYRDALLTVTEPYAFWAVEGDPVALRATFGIDVNPGAVTFAPDIGMYEERKLRLLNGSHTALAPLAVLGGVPTVRAAVEHPRFGAFLARLLFDELVPGADLPTDIAAAFANQVMERFRNPWLEHEWRVIATNQTAKMRVRVAPVIERFMARRGRVPLRLALACAAHLRYLRPVAPGPRSGSAPTGCWRGVTYPIIDADLALMARHWEAVDARAHTTPLPAAALERLATRALADEALWGRSLVRLPGFLDATVRALTALEHDGVEAALAHD